MLSPSALDLLVPASPKSGTSKLVFTMAITWPALSKQNGAVPSADLGGELGKPSPRAPNGHIPHEGESHVSRSPLETGRAISPLQGLMHVIVQGIPEGQSLLWLQLSSYPFPDQRAYVPALAYGQARGLRANTLDATVVDSAHCHLPSASIRRCFPSTQVWSSLLVLLSTQIGVQEVIWRKHSHLPLSFRLANVVGQRTGPAPWVRISRPPPATQWFCHRHRNAVGIPRGSPPTLY